MIGEAIAAILSPSVLLFMLIGVVVGALIGALPGLSVVMAISILTPITFGLRPAEGLAMLMGVYNSGVWAGGISAILVNTPGTPASIMTTLDGHAMTKRGEAGLALVINVIYSAFGGLVSTIILMFAAFPIARFALQFGPAEYFALALFGLSMIIGISESSVLKGIMMGCVGFLISTVGLDSMYAYPRYTFGLVDLLQGISYVPVMIGLFGFGEVLSQIYENKKSGREVTKHKIGRIIPTVKMFRDFAPPDNDQRTGFRCDRRHSRGWRRYCFHHLLGSGKEGFQGRGELRQGVSGRTGCHLYREQRYYRRSHDYHADAGHTR